MRIADYILTPDEESAVCAIYEKLKQFFPSARIEERRSIIGIGEEGRCLFCYFSRSADEVQVKFKTRSWLPLTDLEEIGRDLTATIALFRADPFPLTRGKAPMSEVRRARTRGRRSCSPFTTRQERPFWRIRPMPP